MSVLSPIFRRRALAVAACTLTAGLATGVLAAPVAAAVPEGVATSLVGVGVNYAGQVSGIPGLLNGHTAVDIATTGYSTLALLDDGSLVTTDSQERIDTWMGTLGSKTIVDLESSYSAAYALLSDGSAVMVDPYDQPYPMTAATAGKTFTAIAGGRHAAAGLETDGDVVAWGDDSSGNITDLPNAGIDGNATQIAMGLNHGLALLDDGSVVGWGYAPTFAGAEDAIGEHTVTKLEAGSYTSYALREDGTVAVWGFYAADKSGAIVTTADGREISDIDVYFDDIVLSFADGTIAIASPSAATTDGLVTAIAGKRVLQVEVNEGFTAALLADPTVSFNVLEGTVVGDAADDVVVTTADRIRVAAGLYLGGTSYSIEWDGVEIKSGTTGDSGAVSEDIDVPDSATAGDHDLSIVVDDDETSATVTVAAGLVSATPKVTGAARVGETLTSTRGKWSAGSTFTYSWLRDGKTISGATGSTYTVTPADVAKAIQVKVTGTKAGASVARTSVKTAKVAKGTIAQGSIELNGYARVDRSMSVATQDWPTGTKFAYQWFAGSKAVAKATKSSFVPTASTVDKYLSVRVTASLAGYNSVAVQLDDYFVDRAYINTGSYYPAGTAAVGKTLTAKRYQGSSETPGVTRTYQWLVNGESIPGATKSTFTLTAAHVGKDVAVRVFFAKTGYYPEYTSTYPVEVYAKAVTTGKLTLSGSAKVGGTLTLAVTGTPEGVDVYTYWVRKKGSTVVELEASGPTYTVTAADKGYQIYAQAYFVKNGFATVQVDSALSNKVS